MPQVGGRQGTFGFVPSRTLRASSIGAATALALLTVGVFWVLRGYGPASALRLFHMAILTGDTRSMARVVTSGSSEAGVRILASRVADMARAGGQYRLSSLTRRPGGIVIAEVNYLFPDRGVYVTSLWVLRQEKGQWRLDTDATLSLPAIR
jgi:hypothetical protein